MGIIRALTLVLLLLSVCRPQKAGAQADSLLREAKNASTDSLRLARMSDAVRLLLFNETERARKIAREYLAIAEKAKMPLQIAKGNNFLGMSYFTEGDFETAAKFYLEAMRRSEAAGDSLYAAIVLNNLAACYESRKKPEEAILHFNEALRRFQKLGDKSWTAKVSFNLAKQQMILRDYETSLKNYQLARDNFLELGDRHHAAMAATGVGNYYLEKDRNKEALACYLAAEKDYDRAYDPISYAVLLENKANALIKLNRHGEAEPVLQKALQLTQEHRSLEYETSVLRVLVLLYRSKGDYKKALEWQDRYLTLSDSLYSEEKDAAMVDALKKYDLERKEQQIALLNTRNELQSLQLLRHRRERYLWLSGILALCALAGLLWYVMRAKQRFAAELAGKNEIITKALSEKDLLLREIHHRVKNNLQVISSLLKLQSKYLSDEEALQALNDGRNRVQSMALIHQDLYQENRLTAIEATGYVDKLTETLFRTYNIHPGRVQLRKDIDPLLFDVDTAVPIGLILNELISNALKHAFDGVEQGQMEVALKRHDDQTLLLKVQDNGSGFNPALFEETAAKHSFGIQLVKMLAEKLEAEITATAEKGACIVLKIHQFKLA